MTKRVGFWRRLLATGIDAAFIAVVGGGAAAGVSMALDSDSSRPCEIAFLTVWLAYTALEHSAGGTLGKRLLGLRIANADGTPADGWTLTLRWSTKQLPLIAWLLYLCTGAAGLYLLEGYSSLFVLVGCLYASTEFKQAWHDSWSNTAVFHGTDAQPAVAAAQPNPDQLADVRT